MADDLVRRLVFGSGRRWPWGFVTAAGLLGVAGSLAPWNRLARPWQSGNGRSINRGTTQYPHDARQCLALALIVVLIGAAGWLGVRGVVSRVVLLACGFMVAFIPFADWVWVGTSAPHPPPDALVRFMGHLPHSPSVDAARHYDTSSRGYGLLVTTLAGLLVLAAAVIPTRRAPTEPAGSPASTG